MSRMSLYMYVRTYSACVVDESTYPFRPTTFTYPFHRRGARVDVVGKGRQTMDYVLYP